MARIVRHSALAVLFLAALDAGAQDLGTLFHSPEERARLDRLRRGEPVHMAEAGEDPIAAHKPAITGYVQRSDGRNTVWIDGRPVVIATPESARMLEPRIVQPRGERVAPRDGDTKR